MGSAPVAAYTIAIRMIEFVFLPARGWATRRPPWWARTWAPPGPTAPKAAVWVAARYNVVFMTALGGLFFVSAPGVGLFSDDAEILLYGTHCLRILGLGYPMYAVGMIITQALNGAGDTRTPRS